MLSIITINYNSLNDTIELIDSLKGLNLKHEVIIVDNASINKEAGKLSALYPDVKVIANLENSGFAGGNNCGIKAAKGDVFFFLNNDCIAEHESIERMYNYLLLNKQVGMLNPVIYLNDQPDTAQYAGYTEINPLTGRNKSIGYKEKVVAADKIKETSYVHGAAFMTRRDVVETIGLMPENYFLYYEELDWSKLAKRNDFTLEVDYGSKVYHKVSGSVGANSTLKTYFLTRNRILFMRKNFGWFQKSLFFLFMIFISIPKSFVTYTLSKQFDHLAFFTKALLWNLTHNVKSNHHHFSFMVRNSSN